MMIDFLSTSFSGNTAYGLLRWEGRWEGRGEGGGGKGEGGRGRGKVQTLKDNMADS